MKPPDRKSIDTDAGAQAYYDERYAAHYADGWDVDRYDRIRELVRSLDLPRLGRAVDFGCGRGALTRVLKDALPSWDVVGADLSEVALQHAARQNPDLTFVHVSKLPDTASNYDFVFSHHVLEHVMDLDRTLEMLQGIVRTEAAMLHVLPCGNAGSFEHRLAVLRRDGIDDRREGRFYCDDGPHVRRLTSQQLLNAMAKYSFTLHKQWFGDHNWGARRAYAQKTVRQLLKLTDPAEARTAGAAVSLLGHRTATVLTALACKPTYYRWRVAHGHRNGQPLTWKEALAVACAVPLSVVSTPAVRVLSRLARDEWKTRSSDTGGQEMYLYFRRLAR